MTAFDTRFLGLATRLIDENGKSVTLTSVTTGIYNQDTGGVINTSASATVKAIVQDYDLHSSGQGFASGLIKQGDKMFMIAAAGITKPKPGDTITLDSVVWTVVRLTETWSGEQIAAYKIQARI